MRGLQIQTNKQKNKQIVAGCRSKLAEHSYLNFYLYLRTVKNMFHCHEVDVFFIVFSSPHPVAASSSQQNLPLTSRRQATSFLFLSTETRLRAQLHREHQAEQEVSDEAGSGEP